MLRREQLVVEEAIFLIPERLLGIVPAVHGVGDVYVVLQNLLAIPSYTGFVGQ
jgi:hypothetical protein